MKVRKLGFLVVGAVLLVLTGFSAQSIAGVNVNIGIFAPPPAYVVPAPPPVILIPGSYVYYVPDIDVDILFYHGYWYRPYEGRWYRARYYNGPWVYLASSGVPHVLINLQPNYRSIPPGHRRIPYGQLKKNWGRWEKERYWDRHKELQENRHGSHRGSGRDN
jgi:hypothetical protein